MPDFSPSEAGDIPPVSHTLTKRNIPHRIFRHAAPANSLEEAAAERGQEPTQVVRSILFRLGKNPVGHTDYAMVLVAGPGQISWKALRQYFGRSRLTMATPEEVLAITGYAIGAIAPFGMPTNVPVLVDESVLLPDELSLGSGVRGTAILLTKTDLLHALGDVPIGQFVT